jgi:hypothetical protein
MKGIKEFNDKHIKPKVGGIKLKKQANDIDEE